MENIDLIARLELAGQGFKELDVLIARVVGLPGIYEDNGDWFYELQLDDDGGPGELVPSYTTSLDAALALVPEGWADHGALHWAAHDNGVLRSRARADLHHDISSGGSPRVNGYGETRALAVCVAALKARKSEAALKKARRQRFGAAKSDLPSPTSVRATGSGGRPSTP